MTDTDTNLNVDQPAGKNEVEQTMNILETAAQKRAEEDVEAVDTSEDSTAELDEEVVIEGEEGELDEGEEAGEGELEGEEGDAEGSVEVDPAELSAMFGLEEGDVDVVDDQLQVSVKVDGETQMVPMENLRTNYQLRKHIESKGERLNIERTEFAKEQEKERGVLTNMHQQLEQLMMADQNALLDEYNRVDWDRFQAEKPGEFAAARENYRTKFETLQQRRVGVASAMQEEFQKADSDRQAKFKTYVDGEKVSILEAIPSWNDEATATTESKALRDYALETMNFKTEEVNGMIDHRIWATIRKAWLYDQGATNIESARKVTKKKRVKVRKVHKAGAARTPGHKLTKALARQKEAAKNAKDVAGKVGYVSNLINKTS